MNKRISGEQHIANKCAENIRNYWAERGHKVKLNVRSDNDGSNSFWSIDSDMIDGLPRSLKRGARA